MQLNTLPDLCLEHILSLLPVSDQVKLHQVCHLWASIQRIILRKYRCLTLVLSYPLSSTEILSSSLSKEIVYSYDPEEELRLIRSTSVDGVSKYPHIFYSQLNPNIVEFLSKSFLNCAQVQIYIEKAPLSAIDLLIALLSKWAFNLKSLKICIQNFIFKTNVFRIYEAEIVPKTSEKLLELINLINPGMFSRLGSLTLRFNYLLYPLVGKEHLSWPILSQLERIEFCTLDSTFFLMNSLEEHILNNPNSKLSQISLSNSVLWNERTLRWALQLPLEQCVKFQRISVDYFGLTEYDFQTLCTKYSSLTTLHVNICQYSLRVLTTCLSPLPVLKHLCLIGNFELLSRLPLSAEDTRGETADIEYRQNHLHQLPSVKEVTLSFGFDTHDDVESSHWGWIFPKVNVLRVCQTSDTCAACGYYNYGSSSPNMADECARKIMRQWNLRCGTIESFYFTYFQRKVKQWARADLDGSLLAEHLS